MWAENDEEKHGRKQLILGFHFEIFCRDVVVGKTAFVELKDAKRHTLQNLQNNKRLQLRRSKTKLHAIPL